MLRWSDGYSGAVVRWRTPIVIEARSSQNPGFLRYWHTFSEGVDEVIDARIYSGIHFRTADEEGRKQGRRVAKWVFKHFLRPVKK